MGTLKTDLTLHGVEYEQCLVEFETSDPEPDVGWPGGLDIVSVTQHGRDITHLVRGRDLDDLADECSAYSATQWREEREERAEHQREIAREFQREALAESARRYSR